jgi:hypothetical protein
LGLCRILVRLPSRCFHRDASALSHTHPKRKPDSRSKINKKDKEKKTPCPWPASQQDSPPPQKNPPLPAMRIRGRRRDADGNPSLPTPLQYFDYQSKPPPTPPTDARPELPDAQQDEFSTAFREHIAPSSPRSSPPTASPPSSCRSYSFPPTQVPGLVLPISLGRGIWCRLTPSIYSRRFCDECEDADRGEKGRYAQLSDILKGRPGRTYR